jgi:predicted DNA-binding transcriptional regulator YafY
VRADRLVAIVLLLQTRGQLTAAELAELLETSERTIRRDLDSLLVAGVPLYSQRGRGGGWALLGGHRLDLTGFTVEEAQALFLVAGAGGQSAAGVEPALRSALRKVHAALPEPLRAGVAAATGTTVFDASSWSGSTTAEDSPLLGDLRKAVSAKVQVDLDYAKPGEPTRRRRVHPYGLVSKNGVWYLLAGTAEGRRTFRVSRIEALELTGEAADEPAGFDLATEWEAARRDFFERMQVITVTVEVAARAVLPFTAGFRDWGRLAELEAAREGWRRFSVLVPHTRAAAVRLAPFGADVRVEDPAEVRDELARIGRELVAANMHGT